MNSILDDTKKQLGIAREYAQFDQDIIVAVNAVLASMTQMGIGPTDGFYISDSTATWDDYMDASITREMAKTYIALRTRLIFDPPSNGVLMDAINKIISELEWRMIFEEDDKREQ